MLSAAPKGRTSPMGLLDSADDRLLRHAFGRFGGTAAARADAIVVVRRYQLEAGGHWFLCDCRPCLERPPALVPVMETFIRRHMQAGWPPHAEACEFFREPAEQAEITASYRPLPRVRLVRAFDRAPADPTRPSLPVSSASRRPQLAKLLADLMLNSGLQVVSTAHERPSAPDQLRRLWPVAQGITVDRGVRLSDVLCLSLSRLPALMEMIASAPRGRFVRTRPHGLLVVRLSDVRGQELITLTDQALPVVGRVAVFGEAPEDDPDPPGARSPYLALCVVARPAPNERVQVCSAYAHPCASADRLLLVDSNLERTTLAALMAFQKTARARHGLTVRIEKPLHDLAPATPPGTPAGPPLIPDFIVDGEGLGGGRVRAVVETMGYRDEGYRARKLRLHPEMRLTAGADAVIEHDFHEPGHWPQEWRDNRLGRELWKLFVRGTEGDREVRSA